MLTFRKSQEQLNSFGSISNMSGGGRVVSAIGPSSRTTDISNHDKLPRSGSAKIEDLDIKKALATPASPGNDLDDWDKMIQSFSVVNSPTPTVGKTAIPEVKGHKATFSNTSTNSFSSVDEDLIDQLSGSLGNLSKKNGGLSSSNQNLQAALGGENQATLAKDQVL